MYLEYFNLKSDPFRLSPDSKFYYPSLAHTTAKNYMDYVLWSRDSFILITGEIGSGKTTLIQKMLDDAGPKHTVARLHQTQLNVVEFIQALLDQLGEKEAFSTDSKVRLLSMLNDYLRRKYEEGETVMVIIDEAQNLSTEVLEEIRLMSGFDSDREKLLNIFLVGQPELLDTLRSPQMEQLFQRIRLRFHLDGMDFDEVPSYIRYRLAISSSIKLYPRAGNRKLLEYASSNEKLDLPVDLFPDELMHEIIKFTGGIPRLINTLCDTVLLAAYAKDRKTISVDDIEGAIEDLQWPVYDKRSSYRNKKRKLHGKHKLFINKNGVFMTTKILQQDEVIVGRSSFCDIKIDQKSVSGKHFKLEKDGSSYIVDDLGSTNGTRVNGERISGKKVLHDGDKIEIGAYMIEYKINEMADGDLEIQSGGPQPVSSLATRRS